VAWYVRRTCSSTGDEASAIPQFCPEVEALLAQERTITPRHELMRARVMARAREALKAGNLAPLTIPAVASHHLPYAVAASLALVIATAAFQLLRNGVPGPPVDRRSTETVETVQLVAPSKDGRAAQAGNEDSAPERKASLTRAFEPEKVNLPPPKGPDVKHDTVVEEIALLESAQYAASRNDHRTVLIITSDHESRYPSGRLSEEREALRIRAMIGLGNLDRARQTAARFRRTFPRSVLLPKLDDMVASH